MLLTQLSLGLIEIFAEFHNFHLTEFQVYGFSHQVKRSLSLKFWITYLGYFQLWNVRRLFRLLFKVGSFLAGRYFWKPQSTYFQTYKLYPAYYCSSSGLPWHGIPWKIGLQLELLLWLIMVTFPVMIVPKQQRVYCI